MWISDSLTPDDSVVIGSGQSDQQVVVVPIDGTLPKNSSKLSPLDTIRCGAIVALSYSTAGVPTDGSPITTALLERFALAFDTAPTATPVSYTHLRAHETVLDIVCSLLLDKKKRKKMYK
eukprot:TRINITY_DN27780_c0_g1_i1.p1 TRINITY_DN27780_c0_g1~~TRINITY_DN27780_c0_g1_i1.p1  ORF type:complete len:120 (+),score=11.94 TRINITY_DN27780_c0_g1_i1:87-446(+)